MSNKTKPMSSNDVDQFTARALRVEMAHGVHRGKTFGDIAKTDPSYLRGYIDALRRSQTYDSIRLVLKAFGEDH